jgi:NADH:ubiquinone oxidoreductase subunit K
MNGTIMIPFLAVLALLATGLYGVLLARNLIKVLIALQVLTKGALLALVLAGQAAGQLQLGQSLAVTVIVADTVILIVALALVVQVQRRIGSLDVADLARLKG